MPFASASKGTGLCRIISLTSVFVRLTKGERSTWAYARESVLYAQILIKENMSFAGPSLKKPVTTSVL